MISDELACAGTDPMTYMGHRKYSAVDENSRASSLEYQLQLPETELGEIFTATLENLNLVSIIFLGGFQTSIAPREIEMVLDGQNV